MAGFKGRGAADNRAGRFQSWIREPEQPRAEEGGKPATTVTLQRARSIITRNSSPDVPFEQSINPYQGCEHGCSYCFARPSHAYLDLSPGLDFETRLFVKENAAALLREELSRPGYRCQPIALGTNTDPYQPVERRHGITRALLEVMREFRQPVGIVTKSALVERDIDLLAPMASERLAQVFFSITSLDADLSRRLEPRASAPYRRLEALQRLSEAGIPCGVIVAPVIPMLTDLHVERVLQAAAVAGALMGGYVLLRLPHEVKGLFKDWLERHYPLKARHVLSRLRDMRGGREYDSAWGARMRGDGEYARLLEARFQTACRRAGLSESGRYALETDRFRAPRTDQPSLF